MSPIEKMALLVGYVLLAICACVFLFWLLRFAFEILRWLVETITGKKDKSKVESMETFSPKDAFGYFFIFALILGAVASYKYFFPSKKEPEPMSVEEIGNELSYAGSDTDIFVCEWCGKIASVCTCHTEREYPEHICCDCARENYKVCFLCGKATSEYHAWESMDGETDHKELYYCDKCAADYTENEKLISIDGKAYYLEKAEPYPY